MVFYDNTSGQGLIQDIDFICGTDSTSYPTADKVRSLNRHNYVVLSDIQKVMGRAQFHDSNLTTLTEKLFDLVAGQQQYSLPSDLIKLHGIEIQDSGGNWIRLKEVDQNDLNRSITDYEETDGTPHSYDIRGKDFYLYPAPASGSVTLSGGGKVHGTYELDHFTADDTTQEPGFEEPYHRILSIGASLDYLAGKDQEKYDRWMIQYESLRKALREFYTTRNVENRNRFRPAHSTRDYL